MIVDITPQNFHAELLDASMKKPVVIYFHAPQMPECQAMTPQVEALVGPANAAVTLAKVDMNDPQLQPLASQLALRALPALVLFHQGRPDEQAILEGYVPITCCMGRPSASCKQRGTFTSRP
ncbi:hypothetical protein WP8S18E04_28780 [Aeromonas caviae]|nr:hypothetical protein WP8S18E04_28780 [Aeromonas caviae]